MGKVKKAKLANRDKDNIKVDEGPVAIEHIELTLTNPDTGHQDIVLLKINNGVVEATCANGPEWIGAGRTMFERMIVDNEEMGIVVNSHSLHGIDYLRFNYPKYQERLVHFLEK